MDKIKLYNKIFQNVSIREFCKNYPIVGNYPALTRILKGTNKLSKAMDLRLQSALLEFNDDNFEILNLLCSKKNNV